MRMCKEEDMKSGGYLECELQRVGKEGCGEEDMHLVTVGRGGFGGLEVACWPLVPQVRGFTPVRSRRICMTKKILSTPSFGGEVKPSVPCRSFTACKTSLNVTCK